MTEIMQAMSDGFTTVSNNIMTSITTALPIGLGIAGTVIAVKFAIKFFKSLAKA